MGLPTNIFFLLLFLLNVILVNAATRFSEEPGSCQIIGDTDVYGLGIRIGFYLQWFSFPVALLVDPNEAHSLQVTFNSFSIAVLLNTLINSNTSLLLVEWYIVVNMTVVLNILSTPLNMTLLKKSLQTLAVSLILNTIGLLFMPWFYFTGINSGRQVKPECPIKVSFFFAKINAVSKGWLIFNRIVSIFGAISCLGFIGGLVYVLVRIVKNFGVSVPENTTNETKSEKLLRIVQAVYTVLAGAFVIGFIETTISYNAIDLSGSPITASDQLIPLVIGTTNLFRIIMKAVVNLLQKRPKEQRAGASPALELKSHDNSATVVYGGNRTRPFSPPY